MNIAIVGASEVGLYLAALLSKTDHNIVLIDVNQQKLLQASQSLDIAVRHGSATDAELLKEILDTKTKILIALTESDERNLFICAVAKSVGYHQTIARIRDERYLQREPTHYQNIFGVDHLILPEKLVANHLLHNVLNPATLATAHFAYGNVQMATYQIPASWNNAHLSLRDLSLPKGVMVGLIYRTLRQGNKKQTTEVIFPHGDDVLLVHDEVTFIGEYRSMRLIPPFLGLEHKKIHSAMIIGGSLIAVDTARLLLSEGISVTIIERNYDRCLALASLLPKAMILHQEGTDPNIFDKANVEKVDLFIAGTKKDETNILVSMLAQESGIKQVLAVLSKDHHHKILQKLIIRPTPSPARTAANAILSMIQTKTLAAVAALYDQQAEIIELNFSKHSSLIGLPLAALAPRLPPQMLIAAIQHCGEITIATGSSVIDAGDRVIFIMNPKYWDEIQNKL